MPKVFMLVSPETYIILGVLFYGIMYLVDYLSTEYLNEKAPLFGKYFVKGRGVPFVILSALLMPIAFLFAVVAAIRLAVIWKN